MPQNAVSHLRTTSGTSVHKCIGFNSDPHAASKSLLALSGIWSSTVWVHTWLRPLIDFPAGDAAPELRFLLSLLGILFQTMATSILDHELKHIEKGNELRSTSFGAAIFVWLFMLFITQDGEFLSWRIQVLVVLWTMLAAATSITFDLVFGEREVRENRKEGQRVSTVSNNGRAGGRGGLKQNAKVNDAL